MKLKMIRAVSFVLVLILLGCAVNVWAITAVYTDRTAWQTAVDNLGYNSTSINLDNAVQSGTRDAIMSVEGVNFTTDGGRTIYLGTPDIIKGSGFYSFFTDTRINISLLSNTYAFGYDFGCHYGLPESPYRTNVILPNGDNFGKAAPADAPEYSFIGILSDDPFASLITFSYSACDPWIGNIIFAQAPQPVPEPSTIVLLAAGLAGLAAYGRKRIKK